MDNSDDAALPEINVGALAAIEDDPAAMEELIAGLRTCLDRLDALQLWTAGAHVSQALHEVERTFQPRCAPPAEAAKA